MKNFRKESEYSLELDDIPQSAQSFTGNFE